jgi:chaperone required for assembly of F1-ATPase
MAKPRLKRFYKEVTVGAGAFFQVLLDGRVIKTPGKRALILPTRSLAEMVAAEWVAQDEDINPGSMPLTRFANTAIDAVSEAQDEVGADIVAYAARDLLCYRAIEPAELVRRQSAAWDPVIAWAREALGAHLTVVPGLMPVDQPVMTLKKIASALEPHEAFRLTGLHVMTTLTGSALLALAHARGFLSSEEAWAAAHVDEDYQISLWGSDYEAEDRRKQRHADFEAASRMLASLR